VAEATTGLCATCVHARTVVSARGSTFWRCALSESDARFAKYPRLPVLRCAGHVRRSGDGEGPPPPEPASADR
jgi:hypothetical protein